MPEMTGNFLEAFQKICMEIQLKASHQEIRQMEDHAMNVRCFAAWAERVYQKQNEVKSA